ncbi:hypothetical protein CC80DRAFT_326953 [Byssothecium circinans]|uniref:Uncharacterized protein n=1 Tax=Byssothecium circinans TaxID=147558 RepID=A0A6A5U629_9PLEO|nr:hypothetical protein CC80DRAFT_326953 [Byssothecium circinans]
MIGRHISHKSKRERVLSIKGSPLTPQLPPGADVSSSQFSTSTKHQEVTQMTQISESTNVTPHASNLQISYAAIIP